MWTTFPARRIAICSRSATNTPAQREDDLVRDGAEVAASGEAALDAVVADENDQRVQAVLVVRVLDGLLHSHVRLCRLGPVPRRVHVPDGTAVAHDDRHGPLWYLSVRRPGT
jgi:hypothetical protein